MPVHTSLQVLGDNVRRLRKARGWTQETFAGQSGLHPNYIGGVERGERNVSFLNLLAIARGLACPISDLFLGQESTSPRKGGR